MLWKQQQQKQHFFTIAKLRPLFRAAKFSDMFFGIDTRLIIWTTGYKQKLPGRRYFYAIEEDAAVETARMSNLSVM